MALIVRLIDDIKTETVIKLITVRRIRVMAGPDRIDVVLFHYLQIFFDLCKADCKSRHRIAVVAVCSVEFDLHAVHSYNHVTLLDSGFLSGAALGETTYVSALEYFHFLFLSVGHVLRVLYQYA